VRRSCVVAGALALLAPSLAANGQQLAVRHYGVAEGLAHNEVNALFQDRRGFLWFATREGLSRFDGHSFASYGSAEGLPHSFVHDVGEDAHGTLWVGRGRGGLTRLIDEPERRTGRALFESVDVDGSSSGVGVVLSGRDALLLMTPNGVFAAATDPRGRAAFRRLAERSSGPADPRAFRDREGRLWISLDRTLLVLTPGGDELARYAAADGVGRHWVVAVAQDATGRIVAANQHELYEFVPGDPGVRGSWRRLPLDVGDRAIRALAFDAKGLLWIGTTRGLLFWKDGALLPKTLIGGPQGHVEALLVDRERNLWIATHGEGVFRVARNPVTGYGVAQGLPHPRVLGIDEGPDGRVYVGTPLGLAEVGEDRASLLPAADDPRFRKADGRFRFDRRGDFWFGTGAGDLFFVAGPKLELQRAVRVWSGEPNPSWTGPAVQRDRNGDVWVGADRDLLLKVSADDRRRPRLEQVRIPDERAWFARRLTSDATGTHWFANTGRLVRMREARAELVSVVGIDEPRPTTLFVDSRGWLWVGTTRRGVAVARDSSPEAPLFELFDRARGLSSEAVEGIAEDRRGRMYLGTGRGLDRLDPATGELRHFGVAEGLMGAPVTVCMRDSRDRLWVGTPGGLSRFELTDDAVPEPAPTYVTRVQVSGEDRPVPERGAVALAPLELPWNRTDVRVEFTSPTFEGVRYQYRLIGSRDDWSAPTAERSVTFARLAAGRYRFEVRAVREGAASPPATLALAIAAPLWRRPWFLAASAGVLLAAALGIQRARLNHVLALERLRRQVALDLHDDVGAGLSQIALLSALGREDASESAAALQRTGRMARELREAMGDIVWAVDPRHDSAADLLRRMKDTAFGLLQAAGIDVAFEVPDEAALERQLLAPDRRRHLLLVFKEAVHNVSRHSGARSVRISLRLLDHSLALCVQDDGRGFEVGSARRGNGLPSLRRRAAELGGALLVESRPGGGTRIELRVPVHAA
jgi:signal transduction histidine kinase/ligand-binding sensor domain-containing protein